MKETIMTETRNSLPLAVEHVSGGEAARRSGGSVVSLSGISSGSINLGSATRFRLQNNMISAIGAVYVLAGYTNPCTIANAEYLLRFGEEVRDSVPPGTVLYFQVIDASTFQATPGDASDYLAVTRYE